MLPVKDTIPSQTPPLMTWALLVVNGLVFFYELQLTDAELESVFYFFGLVPARYAHPEWARWVGFLVDSYWPFLTSLFLHGGWLHIIGNMWSLWIFGDNVEDRMGPVHFLLFYLLCGIAASVMHYYTNLHSTLPAVGASGAIAGVMGAYFVLYPTARIIAVFPIFFFPVFLEVPAILYLGIWFYSQLFSGVLWSVVGTGHVGGIAWWAHIGGFVTGMLLLGWFTQPRRPLQADEYGLERAFMRW